MNEQLIFPNAINNLFDNDETTKNNQILLSSICHEIGNPLTLIYSNIQLLQLKQPGLLSTDDWNVLYQDVNELRNLFAEITDLNQSTHLKLEISDLYELVEDVCDSFQGMALQKKVFLNIEDYEIHNELVDYFCDQRKLKQAITNILKNSIEAAFENTTISIQLSLANTDHGSEIQISITNQGTPISPETIPSLFQPFHTSKSTGSGLGLPIANGIVTAHGGCILVHSSEEQSSFIICLPTNLTANHLCQ